jgi:hypothetical protein
MNWLIILGIVAIAAVVAIAWIITRSPRAYEASLPVIDRLPAPARASIKQARDRAPRPGRHRAGASR